MLSEVNLKDIYVLAHNGIYIIFLYTGDSFCSLSECREIDIGRVVCCIPFDLTDSEWRCRFIDSLPQSTSTVPAVQIILEEKQIKELTTEITFCSFRVIIFMASFFLSER